MFLPNLVGEIATITGRDQFSRPTLGPWVPCAFAFVRQDHVSEKSTVRADSSASRGAADQIVSPQATILVTPDTQVKIGDQFRFEGETYLVMSRHPRRSTIGHLDHYELGLETLP